MTNNPVGKQAIAVLPDTPFFASGSLASNVKGSVKATGGADGVGVDFEVTFSNLPTEGGPFSMWSTSLLIKNLRRLISTQPITSMSTRLMAPVTALTPWPSTYSRIYYSRFSKHFPWAHSFVRSRLRYGRPLLISKSVSLDPFIRGEDPACNSANPATCQVGDLSGKYGKITSDPFTAKFHDDFTAVSEGPGSYFLNRSVVVHFANKTRITCANFEVQSTPTPTPTPTTNDGPSTGGSSAFTVGLLVAAMLFTL